MAQVQITFQGTQQRLDRIFKAFAQAQGWTETVIDGEGNPIPNPVSFVAYAKDAIKDIIRDKSLIERVRQSQDTARIAESTTAITDIGNVDVTVAQ